MYDRPNVRKGRYLKIHNMLISMAAPVKNEVIDPWMLFNIIFIMRTNIESGGIQRFADLIVLVNIGCFLFCSPRSSFPR